MKYVEISKSNKEYILQVLKDLDNIYSTIIEDLKLTVYEDSGSLHVFIQDSDESSKDIHVEIFPE
jgi:hypothetical protein